MSPSGGFGTVAIMRSFAEDLRRHASNGRAILTLKPVGNNEGKIHFRVCHDAQILCSAKRLYFFVTWLRFCLCRQKQKSGFQNGISAKGTFECDWTLSTFVARATFLLPRPIGDEDDDNENAVHICVFRDAKILCSAKR
jgi:hypothetical protein